MSDKPYQMALIIGRFQTLHNGHRNMIRLALRLSDTVCILVGSSQEEGTAKNPFSYALRKEMLLRLFPENVKVFPLPDAGLGNTAAWGDYVLQRFREYTGRMPDLIVSGREGRRTSWFDHLQDIDWSELTITKTYDISATQMRHYLIDNDRESWQQNTDPALYDLYDLLREKVLLSAQNTDTASI